MKPAPFAYHRPESLDEALALLAEHGADASVLAGGQSLLPLMNDRTIRPAVVVDINRLHGLAAITDEPGEGAPGESTPGQTMIGALVRQSSPQLVEGAGGPSLLARVLPWVGHVQTRNQGTVCGSLAYGDPLAEIPLALLVNGGSIEVRSTRGQRTVDVDAWLDQAFAPTIEPGELVVASRWRRREPDVGTAFVELAHGSNVCAAAALVEPASSGGLSLRIGVTGTVGRARARSVSIESGADMRHPRELASAVVESWDFIDDPIADPPYRRALAQELLTRALTQAAKQAVR